jgi:zinc and cadmium transporter
MIELIALSFLIMLASLVGVVTVWRGVGSFVERKLDFLVSFSAGVFVVFLYGLASEAVEHAPSSAIGIGWIIAGALALWVVFKFLPVAHTHVHTREEHEHPPLDARRLLVTDAIHNMADGIFLAASYAVSPSLAFVAAVSIFIHEALQELSEFFVLRDAGYSPRRALAVNFLVSSTILVGAIGGYFLLDTFEMLEAPLLALAAGGILVVVLNDLVPHSFVHSKSRSHMAKHIGWFIFGALLMVLVSQLGVEHGGEEDTPAGQTPVGEVVEQ